MLFDFLIEKTLNKKTFCIISGLHGDEPAGNVAANYFNNKSNIFVFANLNPTDKRRLGGKDLNRHFDTKDSSELQKSLLTKIEELSPSLVISLHEDDEIENAYAYCSYEIKDIVKSAFRNIEVNKAKYAHGDKTDNGVIVNGKQPYSGTLERALKRRNILYCTLETPSRDKLENRIKCLKKLVEDIIRQYSIL